MTAIKKDTVVLVIDGLDSDVGETFVVSRPWRKRSDKGTALVRGFEVRPLGAEITTTVGVRTFAETQVMALADANADVLAAARRAQESRRERAEAARLEFERRREADRAERIASEEAADRLWEAATPYVARLSVHDRGKGNWAAFGTMQINGNECLRLDFSVDYDVFNDTQTRTVNWAALGSCRPAQAKAYARLIQCAAIYVAVLDEQLARAKEAELVAEATAAEGPVVA